MIGLLLHRYALLQMGPYQNHHRRTYAPPPPPPLPNHKQSSSLPPTKEDQRKKQSFHRQERRGNENKHHHIPKHDPKTIQKPKRMNKGDGYIELNENAQEEMWEAQLLPEFDPLRVKRIPLWATEPLSIIHTTEPRLDIKVSTEREKQLKQHRQQIKLKLVKIQPEEPIDPETTIYNPYENADPMVFA